MRWSSLRLGGFIVYPCLVRNPVDLPGLPAIIRVRLFKVGCTRIGVRPKKSNVDRSPLPRLLVVKLTASILELADHWLLYKAILAVDPVDAPLVSLRIVETEGQTFDVPSLAMSFELFQIGAAIPNLSGNRSAVKFDPGSGAR